MPNVSCSAVVQCVVVMHRATRALHHLRAFGTAAARLPDSARVVIIGGGVIVDVITAISIIAFVISITIFTVINIEIGIVIPTIISSVIIVIFVIIMTIVIIFNTVINTIIRNIIILIFLSSAAA